MGVAVGASAGGGGVRWMGDTLGPTQRLSLTHTRTAPPIAPPQQGKCVCVEPLECVKGRETASKRHFRSVPSKNKVLQLNGGVIEILFAECHSKSTGLYGRSRVKLRLFLLLRPMPPTMPLSSSCGLHTVHGRLAQLFLLPPPTKSCHSGRGGKARIPNLPTGQFCNGFDQAPRERDKVEKSRFSARSFFWHQSFPACLANSLHVPTVSEYGMEGGNRASFPEVEGGETDTGRLAAVL